LYRTYADNFLNVSADFGRFLYMCARARKAKWIVEFGTSFGISTIHLACALRDRDGGGHLIGSELEPTKAKRARENLAAAGLADLVEIRVGNALEALKHCSLRPAALIDRDAVPAARASHG
jgi:predicted O-methyltransferase YrrM